MSFQQGVTGLNAASRNLDVIGNNVANASTIGAKSSRAEFADIYARASGSQSTGIGVSVATVAQQFQQGNISSTNNSLDVAINGSGFFQLEDANGLIQYTRNGEFKVDASGYVVDDAGMQLLGHQYAASGNLAAGVATPIQLPTAGIAPTATTSVTLEINLDSRDKSTFDAAAASPVVFTDDTTYNNDTSLKVYDDKGQSVGLTYFFQKSDANTWNVYATANGETVNPDGSGLPQPIGTVVFASDGSSVTTPADGKLTLDVPVTGAGTASATDAITGLTIDISGLTQYGAAFGPTNVTQNGFPSGSLSSVNVQSDGVLMATYSTGQSAPLAQIELATFRNVQGLQPLGGNTWAATAYSGEPVLGDPGGGNAGSLESKSLEESNVDLTGELVNMMVAQRIYQANAQTIKTQDSVMQTLVNLR